MIPPRPQHLLCLLQSVQQTCEIESSYMDELFKLCNKSEHGKVPSSFSFHECSMIYMIWSVLLLTSCQQIILKGEDQPGWRCWCSSSNHLEVCFQGLMSGEPQHIFYCHVNSSQDGSSLPSPSAIFYGYFLAPDKFGQQLTGWTSPPECFYGRSMLVCGPYPLLILIRLRLCLWSTVQQQLAWMAAHELVDGRAPLL